MPNDTPNLLAAKVAVRVWLLNNGKTQAWLAGRCGVTGPTLSRVLNGELPPDSVLDKLKKITGVDLSPFAKVA